MRVAIISDTHGLLRPEVVDDIRGCDHILHAGDLGSLEVLEELEKIAPLTAVRGNVDHEPLASRLPMTNTVDLDTVRFYLVHIIDDLDIAPERADVRCIIFGHSHKPEEEQRNGVLFFNPGSIGRRRFKLPITWALATISGSDLNIQRRVLEVDTGEVSSFTLR